MQAIRQALLSDYIKLVVLGAIWASAFICIEIALVDFTPLSIAAWRIAIGTGLLGLVIMLRREKWPPRWCPFGLVILAGLLYNAIPFTLISWGQQYITSGMAAILLSCGPFIALVLSHVMTHDDRFSINKLIGTILGFSGVLVLIGGEVLGGAVSSVVGQLAMVAAVTCYVLSSLLIRRITGASPILISFVVLATSSVYMTPLLFTVGEPFPELTGSSSVIALSFLGLVPTALAYTLRVQIVQEVGSNFLAQVSYLIPPFGLLWSWLLLDQVPGHTTWIALLLIIGGLAVNRFGTFGRRGA